MVGEHGLTESFSQKTKTSLFTHVAPEKSQPEQMNLTLISD
jgi:hypothetical protein